MTTEEVARHLGSYAVRFGDDGQPLRRDGKLVPAVATVSVGTRVAAIDKAFELLARPKPSADPHVRRVLRGIRRTFSVRPQHAKSALDLDGLRQVLTSVHAGSFEAQRERTLALLRARTQCTGGQLARLHWADICLEDTEVTVTLAADRRGGSPRQVRVRAHREETLCLVTALRKLRERAPHAGRLAVRTNGRPLSRQSTYALLDRLLLTWWDMGRSYLCRIVDTLHTGMVDEALFGREVLTRWPQIVKGWP